jgi:hypothetical protein
MKKLSQQELKETQARLKLNARIKQKREHLSSRSR